MLIDGKILGGILSLGQTVNLGLTLSGGVLTICAADGSALSVNNPGWVCVPKQGSSGLLTVLPVTANVTIQDANHATPQLKGSMGITQNVQWADVMPWFIHAINLDNTAANLKFGLSRNPCATSAPASANNIGYAGTAAATSSQTNFILLHSANTNYNGKPCVAVGSIRVACTTVGASEDAMRWSVGALNVGDGFGRFNNSTRFTRPAGQNGAAAGKYFSDNGGTAPVFSTNIVTYLIDLAGNIIEDFYFNGDGGIDGSGAVTLLQALSYTPLFDHYVAGTAYANGATVSRVGCFISYGTVGTALYQINTLAAGAASLNSDYTNGGRTVFGHAQYKSF